MMNKHINTKFKKGELSKPSLIQLDYDNGLMDSLLFQMWLSGKNTPVQKQSALIKKRIEAYAKHFKLKSFLTLMLVALTQLYVDIAQWLNITNETAHRPAEALLWASIEPEAIPYISFL